MQYIFVHEVRCNVFFFSIVKKDYELMVIILVGGTFINE